MLDILFLVSTLIALSFARVVENKPDTLYSMGTLGVTEFYSTDRNSTTDSHGSQYVAETSVHHWSNVSDPQIGLSVTFCIQTVSKTRSYCMNTVYFDNIGSISSQGLYVETEWPIVNQLTVIAGAGKFEGVTGTLSILETEIDDIDTLYSITYQLG